MKATNRYKTYNKFRFASVLQKRLTIPGNDANLFEDYKPLNKIFYSTKTTLKAMEASILRSQRIESDFKLMMRFSDDLSDGDRLIFLSNPKQKNIKHTNLIKVSATKDTTGRREYLEVYGMSGVYAGPAGIQPESSTRIVFKTSLPDHQLFYIADYVNGLSPLDFYKILAFDAWIAGRSDNRFLLDNKETRAINHSPVILSYNNFDTLKAKNIRSPEQTFNFQKIQVGDIYAYSLNDHNLLVAPGQIKLFNFEFTEAA